MLQKAIQSRSVTFDVTGHEFDRRHSRPGVHAFDVVSEA